MILVGRDEIVGPWIEFRAKAKWVPGLSSTIGLVRDGELVAGCLYDDYNGANVNMHIASDGSRSWLNKEFLWYSFYYPFEQLGCKRVTGLVPSSNHDARRFDEHLGFVLEAALKDAHPDGDLLVYRMFRADCRWLNVRSRTHGRKEFQQAIHA